MEKLQINPKNGEVYFNIGIPRYITGRYEEINKIIDDCGEALEINPMSAEVYYIMGILKLRLANYGGAIDEFNKAIENFNKAIEINPKISKFYFNRGISKSGITFVVRVPKVYFSLSNGDSWL